MTPEERRKRGSSFGPAAGLYDRVRPTYPAEAVAWALEPLGPGRHRVADIGAGTGIMTRVLLALGHDTVAVEPDAQMRHQLSSAARVEAIAGSAESLPLLDADVDAAVAAQSYHWFDPERAHPELARVVRRGGVFAAIWNDRDESVAWVNEYTEIIEGDRGQQDHGPDIVPAFGNLFGPVESAQFRHSGSHTPDSLVALLQSRSYFLTASAQRQASLVARVRALAASHPDLAGRDEFDLPYVTLVFRAIRR